MYVHTNENITLCINCRLKVMKEYAYPYLYMTFKFHLKVFCLNKLWIFSLVWDQYPAKTIFNPIANCFVRKESLIREKQTKIAHSALQDGISYKPYPTR